MRIRNGFSILALAAALGGCGLESFFGNQLHNEYDRPASKIRGAATYEGAAVSQLTVTDGDNNEVKAFLATLTNGQYELRLPSSNYTMLRVHARSGNMELRAIVPEVGQESAVDGVDLDAVNTAETIVAEARLTADAAAGSIDANFKKVSPGAYLATRAKFRSDAQVAGTPAQALVNMVGRFIKSVNSGGRFDPASGSADPDFFQAPKLDATYAIKSDPLVANILLLNPFDYVGDGAARSTSADFDTQLVAAARAYSPTGCPDPDHIRLIFTVDFNPKDLFNGACTQLPQFKWATDKPGKQMFFVGWVHKDSDIQPTCAAPCSAADAKRAADTQTFVNAMGLSTPNTVAMYDDGTNGDEKSGDNIWTISFVAPRSSAGKVLRIGYKFTWGFKGAQWSGSEEWPGNSRILEVVDDNADNIVYRRDVWADESTNKDRGNLNPYAPGGSISWTTDLTGCGTPETHENSFYAPVSCDPAKSQCAGIPTPKAVGPIKVACSQ